MEKTPDPSMEATNPDIPNVDTKNIDEKEQKAPETEDISESKKDEVSKVEQNVEMVAPEDDPEVDMKKYDIFRK